MIFSATQRRPSGAGGATLAQDISSHCEAVHRGAEIRHFVMAITVERGMPHRNQRRALALPLRAVKASPSEWDAEARRRLGASRSLKAELSHMGIGRNFQSSWPLGPGSSLPRIKSGVARRDTKPRVPGECSERSCASGTRPGTQGQATELVVDSISTETA